jgi:hypothetical protein
MKTAMQEWIEWLKAYEYELPLELQVKAKELLKKEKEQIQKAFSDGQETPINHPTLPHYSREEYYDDNYKPETI